MPKFKVGDRIKTTVQAMTWNRGDVGTVTKDISNDWYSVSLDRVGQHLISGNEMELETSVNYTIQDDDTIAELPMGLFGALSWDDEAPSMFSPVKEPKCECGVASVGSGMHSTWCPIKES